MTVTFPLTGEPLALDLLNTLTAEGDLVADPAGLADWLDAQAGRLTPVGAAGRRRRDHARGAAHIRRHRRDDGRRARAGAGPR
ncbi:hypothetical protein AB0B44_43460, partial [Streptomyces sp. NPDC041003]